MPGSASSVRAGAAYVELFLKSGKLNKGLLAAQKRLRSWSTSVNAIGLKVFGLGSLIAGGLGVALRSFAAAGDQLDKMSARTGVAASALAEIGFAAEQAGSDMETVEKGLFGLSRALFDAERGSSEANDALSRIGLRIEDLKGLAPEEQFQKVADGLAAITDESTRGAVAQKLLGRAGRQLIPMFADLGKLRQEARELGLVPSDDAVKSAAAVTDAMNRIRRQIKAVVFEVGSAMAPAFLALAQRISTAMRTAIDWVRANKGLVVVVAKIAAVTMGAGVALLTLGTSLKALGGLAGLAASGLSAVGTVVGVAGAALGALLSPIGLIAAALVGGIAAWFAWTDSGQQAIGGLRSTFGQLWETFSTVFSAIKNALAAGDLGLAAQIAMAGVQLAFHQGFAALNEFTGGWLESIKNAFVGAFQAMSFAVRNWKLLLQIGVQSAAVAIVTFGNQVVHLFTEVIPTTLSWFANNWRDIFTDIWNFTKTVASNIWRNITSLWEGIVSFFKGEGFTFEWTPLTEGFKSAIKELPQIAEREIGPLEKSLKDRLNELTDELASEWQQERAADKPARTPEQRVQDAEDRLRNLKRAADELNGPAGLSAEQQAARDRLPGLGEDVAAQSGRVQGTFSAFQAARFAGQTIVERLTKKVVENTGKGAKTLDDIKRKISGPMIADAS